MRNSNLGTKGETVTNENLVYRTAPTTFASPVIPRLHVDEYRNPDHYDTLAETLYRTLDVVLGVASVTRNERSVKFETSYEYIYIGDPRSSGTALVAKAPLLLSDGIDIDLSGESDDPVHDIATKIAEDLTLWHQAHPLPTRWAELVQKLTLFAVIQDVHQPILTIDRILYEVPEGWWS